MADWQIIDLDVSSNQGSNDMGKRILGLSVAGAFLLLIPLIRPSLMAAEDQELLQEAADDVVIRELGIATSPRSISMMPMLSLSTGRPKRFTRTA